MSPIPSPRLANWDDVAGKHPWNGLLVGNGVSRNVWDGFSYDSLYEVATNDDISAPLVDADREMFIELALGSNFEAVLDALLTARTVCRVLTMDTDEIDERYEGIRAALVAAVHYVHLPWTRVEQNGLLAIRNSLLTHDFVFSTNYDLLLYWAMMAGPPDKFVDYFFDAHFDADNTEVWRGNVTRVLYLHGALHLYLDLATGRTVKERAGAFSNLLDRFGRRPDTMPLCITEGTSQQKLAAIGRSDYLWFALQEFAAFSGSLVMIGQGLGDSDAHLAAILAQRASRPIAVGIYPSSRAHIVEQKAWFQGLLPRGDLYFFDSRTHPLGDSTLQVNRA